MNSYTNIVKQHRGILLWYGFLVLICFGGVYFLAGSYFLVGYCETGIRLFGSVDCGHGISPLVVQMNAETLDARVASLLPPLSYTSGVGWHLLGTDALGRDVFAGILYGGQRSLLIGLSAGVLAMGMGWAVGMWSIYARYHTKVVPYWIVGILLVLILFWQTQSYLFLLFIPGWILWRWWSRRKPVKPATTIGRSWWWGRWIEWYQALPDLLMVLVLSAALGSMSWWGLGLIMIAVIWPSLALIARRVAVEVTLQPYFVQAIRNKVSGWHLLNHYLWENTKSVFWGLFPLVVARIILLESTISFLGMGLPPDVVTIGSMVSSSRQNISAWWLIVFSCLFIFILVYPLLRSGMKNRHQRRAGIATN